ncbi:hypothetical protein BM221_000198 [Beauveria bassiana]|uniref:Uncharacterized protein n=1 Tax=Beauveria bassiana TaxID=176275 RepID=A0A2N6NZR7_BEABA|nr:hypothetical protein BM221_000198 [Beauveria bassiana]
MASSTVVAPQTLELKLGSPFCNNLLLVGHNLLPGALLDSLLGSRRLLARGDGEHGSLYPALDAAVAPVGDDGHGGGVEVGDAAAAEAAALAGDLDEEVGGEVAVEAAGKEGGDVVDVGELLQEIRGGGEAAEEETDGGDRIVNLLGGYGVEQDEVRVGVGGVFQVDEARGLHRRRRREDDAGRVEQRQLAVNLDGANARGDARLGARGARTRRARRLAAQPAQQRVDDGALADVGVANDPDGHGALEVAAGREALERPKQRRRRVLHRQLAVVKRVRVGGGARGAQRQRGKVPPQVHEPVAQHLGRHQVNLVEDEDQALPAGGGAGHDAALDLARAGALGVAGVEHVQHHVGFVNDLFEDLVVRLARRGLAGRNLVGVQFLVVVFVVVLAHVVVGELLVFGSPFGVLFRQLAIFSLLGSGGLDDFVPKS